MKLPVPTGLKEIDRPWVLALICLIDNVKNVDELKVVQLDIQIQPNTEGVLSDICKVRVEVKHGPTDVYLSHRWFIKVVPQNFKSIVTKHRLFNKEIAFYRYLYGHF